MIIEFDEKCQTCGGTGLYVGLAEHDGAGIVCIRCKGTGIVHFKHEYEEPVKHVRRNDVTRVYESNPGIVLKTNSEKGCSLADFGGMSFDDWDVGKPFPKGSENRLFVCPAWWYQSVDYKKKPDWDICTFGGTFSGCDHFGNKDKCWKRFDSEQD